MNELCPCKSGKSFDECCKPLIQGNRIAPTAESLMRSRYTAFTLADADYLMKTWAPETRNLAEKEGIRKWARSVKWVKLKILHKSQGEESDTTGLVSFQAFYREKGELCQIHETSYFEKRAGEWVYVIGKHE